MQKQSVIKISIVLAFILCCVLFGFKSYFNPKTTIQFASWGSESELSILKPVLKDFEKENPDIKVDFMHIPQNYFQKIHLLFASNTAPDVIFINNHYLPIYANAGVLENLSEDTEFFDYKNIYSKALEALSWNNNIYAVPRDVSSLVVFYNKDLFKKYNVAYPKKGYTVDDFLTIAEELTHMPESFGVSFDEEPLFFLPYLTVFGVDNFKDLYDKDFQEGIKFYSSLRNVYHVAPLKEEVGSTTMAQMFLQGKLGMHVSGRWLVPKYRQEAKFDWDVAEFPKGPKGNVVPLDASGWAVAKSSSHKKEALKLVQYLASKDISEKFCKSGLVVPARIDVANSSCFLDGRKPANAKVFLDAFKTAKPTYVDLDFKKNMDNLRTETEYLFNEY